MKIKHLEHTKNSQSLSAESQHIHIQILGDLDYENMDALAVTLKLKKQNSQAPPIRKSLDLYREESVSHLIEKLCERFELSFSETQQVIYDFIETLEDYRFKHKQKQSLFSEVNNLAKKDIQSATHYLTGQNVIEEIKNDLKQAGIRSHINEALLLYVAMATRKQTKPLSLTYIDDSIITTKLMDTLIHCMPLSDYFFPSSISSQALYYFTSEELQNKVLLLSDLHTKTELLPILSELITKQSLSKVVALKDKSGLPFIMSPHIEAKLCVLGTIKSKYRHKLKPLNTPKIPIDTKEEDHQNWLNYTKQKSAGLINLKQEREARERLIHLQSLLQPINVINPYALDLYLPSHHNDNIELTMLLLELINAITYIHQYRREKHTKDTFGNTTSPYIQTELEDIKIALELLKPLLEKQEDILPMASRRFFEKLKNWSKENKHQTFYTHMYRKDYPNLAPRTLGNHCKHLTDAGYLTIEGGNKHKGGYLYKIAEQDDEKTEKQNVNTYKDYTNKLIKHLEEKCETSTKQTVGK